MALLVAGRAVQTIPLDVSVLPAIPAAVHLVLGTVRDQVAALPALEAPRGLGAGLGLVAGLVAVLAWRGQTVTMLICRLFVIEGLALVDCLLGLAGLVGCRVDVVGMFVTDLAIGNDVALVGL